MKCRICGGVMESRITDLPFKLGDTAIVIVRAAPVLQCCQCGENELEHSAMLRVDDLLAVVGPSVELKIIRYAA
jgi:YgiT-type zinc finger domain-containing protein